LIGDSVDNIGGVPGVGEKTATRLLQEYGDLDTAYARLSEISSERLRNSLQDARPVVDRNRELIRLRTDLPGAFDSLAFRAGHEDVAGLAAMYARWGFKSMLAQLNARQPAGQVELFSAA
jgi:DNA polymerase-1